MSIFYELKGGNLISLMSFNELILHFCKQVPTSNIIAIYEAYYCRNNNDTNFITVAHNQLLGEYAKNNLCYFEEVNPKFNRI